MSACGLPSTAPRNIPSYPTQLLRRAFVQIPKAAFTISPTHRQPRDVLRAADIFLENGVFIETGRTSTQYNRHSSFYVYEPGGNRVEAASVGARLILAPDWQPIVWTKAERAKGQAWGLKQLNRFTRTVHHP